MATQRLSVIAIGGDRAEALMRDFQRVTPTVEPADLDVIEPPSPDGRVDQAWKSLLARAIDADTHYFTQWFDCGSMGDTAPGFPCFDGAEVAIALLSCESARARAAAITPQFPESVWLATRIREAADSIASLKGPTCVIIAREVLGPSRGAGGAQYTDLAQGIAPLPWPGTASID